MKLNEIGEKMWRSMYTTEFFDSGWYEDARKHELKHTEEVWVFTEKERRELVRLCLNKIFAEIELAGLPFDRMDRQIIDEDIETFIKREGL
jgi:hypothetical protein